MSAAGQARPWLSRYTAGMPSDIPVAGTRAGDGGFANALEMFTDSVRDHPDRPLVHYFDRTMTLGEIDRASDALAAALVSHGFSAGDRLAVYLQNVPQYVLAVLGTWKAGGIVVPVNPMSKERELTYVLDDSGATFLVSLESLYHDVAGGVIAARGVPCTVITTSELDLLDASAERPTVLTASKHQRPDGTLDLIDLAGSFDGQRVPPPTLQLDDIAFLTYTSGTTGPPKGAMNTHGNVVFNAESYRTWMSLTPDDVVLGVAPLFHITGLIAHLAVALLVPMPIVLGFRFDPSTTLDLIETPPADVHRRCDHGVHRLDERRVVARTRPVVVDQGVQRRRAHRSVGGRALRTRGRRIHPQHLRADRDHVAVARRPDGCPRSGRSGFGRAVGRGAHLQHGGRRDRRRRQRGRAGTDRRVRHQRAAGGGRATGTSPTRRRTRCPAAACTPATSGSWTTTAGSTWSTARRT